MSQELAALDQVGLGVRQSNGETTEAKRLVTRIRISYSSADMTAVAAPKASRRECRRVEKPLLNRVLRRAMFKAQHERKSVAKDPAVIAGIIDALMNDVEMKDIEATRPLCDTAPDTAISSGQGTRDEQSIPGATVEDIEVNAIKAVDPNT